MFTTLTPSLFYNQRLPKQRSVPPCHSYDHCPGSSWLTGLCHWTMGHWWLSHLSSVRVIRSLFREAHNYFQREKTWGQCMNTLLFIMGSSLIKPGKRGENHSCFNCWSYRGDTDQRVLSERNQIILLPSEVWRLPSWLSYWSGNVDEWCGNNRKILNTIWISATVSVMTQKRMFNSLVL